MKRKDSFVIKTFDFHLNFSHVPVFFLHPTAPFNLLVPRFPLGRVKSWFCLFRTGPFQSKSMNCRLIWTFSSEKCYRISTAEK